jgi:AraC-like DNA-binding protein
MTMLPKYLKQYPNMNTAFPFHIGIHTLVKGYEAHRHDFLEFSFVIDGEGLETVNGVSHRMLPGTFTFVLPYQIHEIRTESETPLRLFNCMFGMDFVLGPHLELAALLTDSVPSLPSHLHLQGEEKLRMSFVLEEMLREYSGMELWKSALLTAKLTEALVLFDRLRRSAAAIAPCRTSYGTDRTIWHVMQYVHAHFQEDLHLAGLAERFGFSVSYLSELFKKKAGQNFVGFLHDIRIRHACGLLASTEMSVADIAMEVGYGSYKTFSRMFKENKGMTPAAYRKRHASADSSCVS